MAQDSGALSVTVRGAVMTEPKLAALPANMGTPPVQLLALYHVPSPSMFQAGGETLISLIAASALPLASNSAVAPLCQTKVLGTGTASGYHQITPRPLPAGRFFTVLRMDARYCCWPAGVDAN